MDSTSQAPASPTPDKQNTTQYTEEDIRVLEGLEAVRERPAMYVGGTDT
jgi:hypothetical protein